MPSTPVHVYRADGSSLPYELKAHTFELRDDGVAIVSHAVPKTLHSLTSLSRQEMFILLEHMRRDTRVKVCVWTAQGDRSFCSGASIAGDAPVELPEDVLQEYARRELAPNMRNDNALVRETKAFWDFPKPIIGASTQISPIPDRDGAMCNDCIIR